MRPHERLRVADCWERRPGSLGQVLQDFFAARHEPLPNRFRPEKAISNDESLRLSRLPRNVQQDRPLHDVPEWTNSCSNVTIVLADVENVRQLVVSNI